MRLTRDGKLIRTDIWREGEYLDLWSIPHFLSGIGVGLTLFLFGFAANAAVVIAFLLLVAYEMFEVIAKIEETRWNRILDVVVGMVSCVPSFYLADTFTREAVIITLSVVLAADLVLSAFGWLASRKAYVLETKLKAEFEKEKEKFDTRRAQFKTWRQERKNRRSNAIRETKNEEAPRK